MLFSLRRRILLTSPLRAASAAADPTLVWFGRKQWLRTPIAMTSCCCRPSIRTAQPPYHYYNCYPPPNKKWLSFTTTSFSSSSTSSSSSSSSSSIDTQNNNNNSSNNNSNNNNDAEQTENFIDSSHDPFQRAVPGSSSILDHFQGRNILELHQLTDQLLRWYAEQQPQTSPFTQEEVRGVLVDTEKAIRWWTTFRTIEGVQTGLKLFQELVHIMPRIIPASEQVSENDQQDVADDNNNNNIHGDDYYYTPDGDDDDYYYNHIWTHWFMGRHHYPIATHVLNALVDSWRICWTSTTTMATNQEQDEDDEKEEEALQLASFLPTPREMLQRVMHWHTKHGIPLDARTFSIIMLAAVEQQPPTKGDDEQRLRRQRESVPLFCEKILNLMLERGNLDEESSSSLYPPWFDHRFAVRIRPGVVSYGTALNAWAESGRPDAAERARQLLEDVLQLYSEGWLLQGKNNDTMNDGKPTVGSYNTVLKALVSMHQTSDMEQAERMLQDMLVSPHVTPDGVTFRTVMEGWLAIGNVPRAYAVLNQMIELYETGYDVDVDATYFSKLIFVLAKNKDVPKEQIRTRAQLAMQLYEQLIALYHKTNDPRFEPELTTIRSMIMVWASLDCPEEAEILLTKLEELATVTNDVDMVPRYGHYGDVVFAWSRSGLPHAVERAESLLLRWIQAELTKRNHMNNNSNENPGDDANEEKQDQYLVDDRSAGIVFDLWTKSPRDDACERAEALLRNLQKINESIGHPHDAVVITPSHYLGVMLCWSRSGRSNGAERTQAILSELLERHDRDPTFQPTRFHFTTAIEAWTYSNDRNAPQRAQLVFDEAVARATPSNEESIPDNKLYSSLINACATNWQPQKAEEALLRMLHDKDNGNMLLKPTAAEFNLVLRAWVKSRTSNAQRRCQALLSLMQERGIQPNKKTHELMEKAASNRGSLKTTTANPSLRKKTTVTRHK